MPDPQPSNPAASLPLFRVDGEAFQEDPLPTYRRMHASGEIIAIKAPLLGTIPALTGHAAVDQMLRQPAKFARDGRIVGKSTAAGVPRWIPRTFRLFAENMLATDGNDHRRLRGLVDQAFFKRNVDSMQHAIVGIADRLLDDLESGSSDDHDVDLLEAYARQLPLAVICELLGLPQDDRQRFTRWFQPIGNFRSAWSLFGMIPGLLKIRRYLQKEFRRVRETPGTGLITELVRAEQDGAKLSEDELLAMVFLLLVAGHETTTHLISCGTVTLLDHPDQLGRLTEDWSLASTAVDEILRYSSVVQMTKPRYVTENMDCCGHPLQRGDLIVGLLACANFDPRQFDSPESFDISRSPNRHLSFGSGIHVCLGLKLAKMEAAIAWQRLWQRFPNLRLAVPHDQLHWRRRLGIRSLESLPLHLQ